MSARGIGHIAHLATIAPPKIGVVLNVGSAHIGEFGSRENIAIAKGELVEALPADGVAVLNADDDLVAGMAPRTAARVVTFSETGNTKADYYATDVELDAVARASFTMHTPNGSPQRVELGVFGATRSATPSLRRRSAWSWAWTRSLSRRRSPARTPSRSTVWTSTPERTA